LFELEGGDATANGRPYSMGAWKVLLHGTPERNEHPRGAACILPRGHRAPHAVRIEHLIVVADERCSMQLGAFVGAAKVVAIEQPDAAFLARRDQELSSSIVDGQR
jgi:hypothetical protein